MEGRMAVRLYIKYKNKNLINRTAIHDTRGYDHEKAFERLCGYSWEKWAEPILVHYEIFEDETKITPPDENYFKK